MAEPPMSASACPTKPIQCCNVVRPSDDPVVKALLELLGVHITGTVVPVGVTCTPISVCILCLTIGRQPSDLRVGY